MSDPALHEKLMARQNEIKKADSSYTSKKTDFKYVEKETDCNGRVSRRKKTIELECLETEMLTGVRFHLSIKPAIGAPRAKVWTYTSPNYFADEQAKIDVDLR